MAKKNTLVKGVGDTPTPKIIRNYDPMSMEQRIHNLENGGSDTKIVDLTDVSITSPSNGQVLTYNSTSQKWENDDASGSDIHEYSTTEKKVGKWIDDSDVYEKVISSLDISTTVNNWVTTDIVMSDVTQIIDYAVLFDDNNAAYSRGAVCGCIQLDGDDKIKILPYGTGKIKGLILKYVKGV